MISECKINTFAIFIFENGDNSAIDVMELIKNETVCELGMTQIDHDMLME